MARPLIASSTTEIISLGEQLAATMTPFSLEDALSSAAVPSRRNPFMRDPLETGVHFNVDYDGRPPKATMSPQILTAGRPRLVDGAREDHIVAGYQNLEGCGSDNAAMRILAQGPKGDPSMRQDGYVVDEHHAVSHSECLEYLYKNGPSFLTENLQKKETICSVLLNMAEHVKVLAPADEPIPWDVLSMSLWKVSLCELIKEMKTVEEKCPSLICNSGVYVLTTSSYDAFLRALAMEIADRRS